MREPGELVVLGVREGAAAIRAGETTCEALVDASLARIAATDGALGAWVTVDPEGARSQARARDEDVRAGRPTGPLHGVPIGVKDIIDVAGLPTTAGAAAFAHTRPALDATLVARLRDAGAVIIGKTVATQFAWKDPAPTLNPWSAEHTPGGSSSGSAAAVAARHVPAAIGTQTIGSILRPAAFCGVVGLKGPHGAVPLDGVVPLSWSLDHAGVITRSVDDAVLVEAVLLGRRLEVPRIVRPRLATSAVLFDQAGPALRAHLDGVVRGLVDAGADIVDVDLPPSFGEMLDAGRVVLEAEAAAWHEAWFAANEADYAPRIADLIRSGLGRMATELVRAQRVRAAFRDAVLPLLARFDALLSPVAPGPAALRREGTGDFGLCAPWSFTGVPSIAIPSGIDGAGLPLALQLVGASVALERLLGAAAWCESVLAFDGRPAVSPGATVSPGGTVSRGG